MEFLKISGFFEDTSRMYPCDKWGFAVTVTKRPNTELTLNEGAITTI